MLPQFCKKSTKSPPKVNIAGSGVIINLFNNCLLCFRGVWCSAIPLQCFLYCILELCGKTLGSEISAYFVAKDMIHPVRRKIGGPKLNRGDGWDVPALH